MRASEIVTELQTLIGQHGDLNVENELGHRATFPEFNDDEGACFMITFDED